MTLRLASAAGLRSALRGSHIVEERGGEPMLLRAAVEAEFRAFDAGFIPAEPRTLAAAAPWTFGGAAAALTTLALMAASQALRCQ